MLPAEWKLGNAPVTGNPKWSGYQSASQIAGVTHHQHYRKPTLLTLVQSMRSIAFRRRSPAFRFRSKRGVHNGKDLRGAGSEKSVDELVREGARVGWTVVVARPVVEKNAPTP